MNALGVERLAVVLDIGIGMQQAPLQPLELQGLKLVAAGALDPLELAGQGSLGRHADSFAGITVRPVRLCERPRTRATRRPCWLVTTMS